ncbi:MAG: prephenate dehydrogenase/arogenate dehydrogenase family protein [Methanomicrobiales archaeon]|nr:prephenate dehydrogenase/arogenate dehydrogenase family protein [Methanomicrobiales archaeon]
MRIAIIGGTGRMGQLFAGVFSRAGHDVAVSGRRTAATNCEVAAAADMVIVSVPIRKTRAVIEEIAPVLTDRQVIADLTSLKTGPVEAMLATPAAVCGLHPMFGPGVSSLKNQLIVATPARCPPQTLDAIRAIFEAEGAKLLVSTPEEHDRMMAVVQGLVHYATLCLADAMRRASVDVEGALLYASPVYRIELGLIGRILGQDSGLYGPILQDNPLVPPLLEAFSRSATELRRIIEEKDDEAFAAFFGRNSEAFAGFIPAATKETDALIAAMAGWP